MRRMISTFLLTVLVCFVIAFSGCSDTTGSDLESTSTLTVNIVTSGAEKDIDGYLLVIDEK